MPPTDPRPKPAPESRQRLVALAILAVLMMAPVTMPVPVLRGLVQERFAVSELLTSFFMSINMLGGLFAAPFFGAFADRFGKRRSILIAALCADGLCLLALTLPTSFAVFLAVRLLEGCAHIAALSILLSLASHALPASRRGRAMGLVGGCMMMGVAFGAPLGGVLGRQSPLVPLYVGAALLYVAAAVASRHAWDPAERDDRPGFGQILSALRAHPQILVPLAFAFADRFTVGFFTTTFPLFVTRIWGFSSEQIGFSIASFMIPFALLSYPFGRVAERYSQAAMLCGGSLVYGIGTASVGFAGPSALGGLMFAIGVTAAVMFVPSMLMTIQIAPDRIRTTALGAFNAAGSLGFIVGPVTGGLVSQVVAGQTDWLSGYRAAFLVAGMSEVLCVAVAIPILLRQRRAA